MMHYILSHINDNIETFKSVALGYIFTVDYDIKSDNIITRNNNGK